jgi:uncharacterized protein (TIGR04255 family)
MRRMNETDRPLHIPPIVEAVLDIECDFAPGFDLTRLEESSKHAFQDNYPRPRSQLLQEFKFETKPGGLPEHSERRAIQAFQFWHDDEKQIVQVRTAGYSFNRLAPYSSFDDYLPEIHRTWDLYRAIAMPIQVRAVQLRYINRISLPLTDGRVELDEYFKNGPRLPEGGGLILTSFVNQYQALEEGTGNVATTVLTAQLPQGNRLPIIFDNVARAGIKSDPADWQRLESTLRALRDLKNRVFRNTLSNKCLSLFQ